MPRSPEERREMHCFVVWYCGLLRSLFSRIVLLINTENNHHHHHRILLLLVEHGASMMSFQALRSSAIPLTSFHDLPVLLISSSIVLHHVLFGLPLILYPWAFQSNAVFSVAPASLRNVCPIQLKIIDKNLSNCLSGYRPNIGTEDL